VGYPPNVHPGDLPSILEEDATQEEADTLLRECFQQFQSQKGDADTYNDASIRNGRPVEAQYLADPIAPLRSYEMVDLQMPTNSVTQYRHMEISNYPWQLPQTPSLVHPIVSQSDPYLYNPYNPSFAPRPLVPPFSFSAPPSPPAFQSTYQRAPQTNFEPYVDGHVSLTY
jgi:hypothetical protein